MEGKGKILWSVRTAVFIALVIILQAVTAPLGQLVTGSIVNLLLIISVMIYGYMTGISVAAISPVMAKLVGIGPFWSLIPFIILGNVVLVLLWRLIGNSSKNKKNLMYILALVVAAICKFLVLYFCIARIVAPLIIGLPPASPVYTMFSFPQLITASIGGVIAILILPTLRKAVRN